jgi:RHS repeat-associated protein
MIDGSSADTAGFEYDVSGRLCRANLPGRTFAYRYGGTACQVVTSGVGANGNRTQLDETVGSTTTSTSYGYDPADRLTSVTGQATPTYDNRGRTLTVAGQTLTWDGADRNVSAGDGTTTVTYTRDALDRVVARTEGATTIRYGYTGAGDSPAVVLSNVNAVIERTYGLPGGVLLTVRASTQVWSYPNIHGDIAAVADAWGVKQGATFRYDPYGQPLTTTSTPSADLVPDNADQQADWGWLGQHQRLYDHTANLTIIQMGARPYHPTLGRFLTTDPIEGGCTNDYVYVDDPVNRVDLNGSKCRTGFRSTLRLRRVASGGTAGSLTVVVPGSYQGRIQFRSRTLLPVLWTVEGDNRTRRTASSLMSQGSVTFGRLLTFGPAPRGFSASAAIAPLFQLGPYSGVGDGIPNWGWVEVWLEREFCIWSGRRVYGPTPSSYWSGA